MRSLKSLVIVGLAVLGFIGAAFAVASPAVASPTLRRTIRASRISRSAGTLAPGTKIRSTSLFLGQRIFVDARHGFELADVGQAQYPAASTDGGRTWRTNGPALHVDAAQAPFGVADIGALSRRLIYAYGGGQAVDVSSDGGRTWRRALFDGLVMSVVANSSGHLLAFVDTSGANGRTGATRQYFSQDGGRSWHYTTFIGGL
jgi:BNR/Asp-box repeat